MRMVLTALISTLLASVPLAPAATAAGSSSDTIVAEKLPLSEILVLEGEGYALGHAHGLALKPEITLLQEQWLMPKLRMIPWVIEQFARAKVRNMEPFLPQVYRDEIRGMSEAVGIEYEIGLIVNAIPDVMELASRPFGCSTFVALPGRSESGGLLYGRNLDYGESDILRSHWKPTVFARPGKNRILSINVPGMTGVLTAINDKGVMMSRMTSYSRDIRSNGYPSMVLFRQILEEAYTAEEATQMYELAARTVAVNVMISDKTQAIVLEATARQAFRRVPSAEGLLYAANHYETESLKDGRHERDARWPHLARFDGTSGAIGAADVLETMARAETVGRNILAVVVDHGTKKLVFGSDPEGNGTAARGKLYEIDLAAALPGF